MKSCSVNGCTNAFYGRNFCKKHYIYARRGAIPHRINDWRKCRIYDCKRAVVTGELCLVHHKRIMVCGDPMKTKYRKIGSGTISSGGYIQKYLPGHPCGDKRGLTMEHRAVMSEILGRHLTRHEKVHHKNGDKQDNRIENLELWSVGHPKGQRALDLVDRAKEILKSYEKKCCPSTSNTRLLEVMHDLNTKGKITKNGYKMIRRPGEGSQSSGYIMEHRYVMQLVLGRHLTRKENIHHKDGNKLNNDLNNLELWTVSQPCGQRVSDLVLWAKKILKNYKNS